LIETELKLSFDDEFRHYEIIDDKEFKKNGIKQQMFMNM
jgi:hypothetical protein